MSKLCQSSYLAVARLLGGALAVDALHLFTGGAIAVADAARVLHCAGVHHPVAAHLAADAWDAHVARAQVARRAVLGVLAKRHDHRLIGCAAV